MAFNLKTFQTRTLTAIVFAAVMLLGLLWSHWSFLVLFSIIHFGCWWEYLKLSEKIYKKEIDSVVKYFFCICGYFVFLGVCYKQYIFEFGFSAGNLHLNFTWLLIIMAHAAFFAFLFQYKKIPARHKWFITGGLIYISISLGLMGVLWSYDAFHLLRFERNRNYIIEFFGGFGLLPVVIVFSIWINDTMAYIVGSLIGKTPLSKISPKKTWEGTLGGIMLSVLLTGLLFTSTFSIKISQNIHTEFPYRINNSYWYIIAAITSISGTLGDLLESKLKRMAGIKDSGSIMPGHGGFLDRFDSMLLATPAVWIYIQIFLN